MSHRVSSTMNSPVSISGVESVSVFKSTTSLKEDKALDTAEHSKDVLFNSEDGDLYLVFGATMLSAHKYLIKRFSGLKDRIQNNIITMESHEPGAKDFQDTFKILYASVVEGPFDFDRVTLTSALRVATTYDYPALRIFAIKHLEESFLTAIERIRLAREFGLSSWEEPAYVELCNRDEAITVDEASVLGMNAFVNVAKIREKEQRRRGKEVDAGAESSKIQVGKEPGVIDPAAHSSSGEQEKDKVIGATLVVSGKDHDSSNSEQERAKATPTGADDKGEVGTMLNPSFIDAEVKETYSRGSKPTLPGLEVPGCVCRADNGWQEPRDCKCKLLPCAFRAFKNLQTQQLAHTASISKLKAAMEQFQAVPSPPITNPEPCAKPYSEGSIHAGCVQGEVHRWLASSPSAPSIQAGASGTEISTNEVASAWEQIPSLGSAFPALPE